MVENGEFVSIVGPSGCGKSTFLHILGGFEPADSGTMLLNGVPIAGPGPDRGMLFQEFALFPWRSVIGNVGWALEVQGVPKAERLVRAGKFLELVGLSGFARRLSGRALRRHEAARCAGARARIRAAYPADGRAVRCARCADARADAGRAQCAIWQQTRNTVLFVTHDIDEAIYLSDRVIVFTARPGRLKDEIRIDLPRPRSIDVKKSGEYLAYRNRVWDSLRSEVLKAREEMP